MKKIIGICLLLVLVLFLSGCDSVKNSKVEVEKTEMERNDEMRLKLHINYTQPLSFSERRAQDFRVTFYSGDYLEIYEANSNNRVTTDIIRNVSKNATKEYEVRSRWPNDKKVERIEVLVVSEDSKLAEKIKSPFIEILP